MIGAGQVGDSRRTSPAPKHSMVVDPWGVVLAERIDPTPGIVVADLEPEALGSTRRRPVLANRRPPPTVDCMSTTGARGTDRTKTASSRVLRAPNDLPEDNNRRPPPPTRSANSSTTTSSSTSRSTARSPGPRVPARHPHGRRHNRRLASDLAPKGNRVILLDLPDYGLSAGPSGRRSTGWTDYTGHVVALLDHLGIDQAVSAACRWAATSASWWRPRRLERVRGLVVEMPVLEWALPAAAILSRCCWRPTTHARSSGAWPRSSGPCPARATDPY